MANGKRKTPLSHKKDRAAYITAIASFLIGWGLTIAGFCVPPVGEVSNSVLAILGEALIYAASAFGIALYFNNQMAKFKADTRRYLRNRELGIDEDETVEEEYYGEE